MNYCIYRVEDEIESGYFDRTSGLHLLIDRGAYIFYRSTPALPEVVYPINKFYVIKEE